MAATATILEGRTLYVPRMTFIGARMLAAAFRSVGIESRVVEPADERTLELGALYTSGEECYPQKITMGDFLKILNDPKCDPSTVALFMPTAEGPCRFGQYAPLMRQVLNEMGCHDVPIISPSSRNSYDGITDHGGRLMRTSWRAIVAADILRKCLLKTRPYETVPGAADEAYARSMELIEAVIERPDLSDRDRLAAMVETLGRCRELFAGVSARYMRDRLLIGIVGEIFCRMNTFSNDDAIRKIEAHGGEAWLSDTCEWVWYTNWGRTAALRRNGRGLSLDMLKAVVKHKFQAADEHALLAPFAEDLIGYEEPHHLAEEILAPGQPYLPAEAANGEMVLSIGKAIYLQRKGADGVIDISPFSCMNGIVCEAIYPSVSRDYDGLPIRNFYFDASSSNMERDLDIFMELAAGYGRRKKTRRRYPAYFGEVG